VLNAYERAFKSRPNQKDLRWRIEHAQHISATMAGVLTANRGRRSST